MLPKIGTHSEHEVALSNEERSRHLYVVGRTGTGKSTMLLNLMRQDLASGRGFALIDPHGDLATSICDAVPQIRYGDIVYFDPLDTKVVNFNPLSHSNASQIVSAFKHVWRDSWGPRMEYILKNTLLLLNERPHVTFLDLRLLLRDVKYRDNLVKRFGNERVKNLPGR
jgi:hypothetical protein